MTRIEIVTHCYAGVYQHYADALRYQFGSLIANPPRECSVSLAVCFCHDDEQTWQVFLDLATAVAMTPNLDLILFPLALAELGRRAIGRNKAAKSNKADVVWFTDCDVCFGPHCLDALAAYSWPEGVSMVFPRHGQISRTHAIGQETLDRASSADIPVVDPTTLKEKGYGRAIGPIQIVPGDLARRIGYLDGHPKHQQPRTDGKPFADFRDDIAARKQYMKYGRIEAINLANWYRIRHAETTHT